MRFSGCWLSGGVLCAGIVVVTGCGTDDEDPKHEQRQIIQTRALFDLSGATADVGAAYHAGVLDHIAYLNDVDAFDGYEIAVEWFDYAYDVDTAIGYYDGWRTDPSWADVVTVFGWGTGDTMALSSKAAEDEKVYISASYAGSIASPVPVTHTETLPDSSTLDVDIPGAPYNFFAGTDYSTAIRIALEYIKNETGQKVAFAYCDNSSFCTDPIPAGMTYAAELELTVGNSLHPALSDDEATIDAMVASYFADAANSDVDWIWVGNTVKTAAWVGKAVAQHAPANVKVIANTWGFDETVIDRCGDPCKERYYGVTPFAAYGDGYAAGMTEVVYVHNSAREAANESTTLYEDTHYIQGFTSVLLWKAAALRLLKAGEQLTSATLKQEVETFNSVSLNGLTPPVSYSASDHRPLDRARIYKLSSYGTLALVDEVSVDLLDEWKGW